MVSPWLTAQSRAHAQRKDRKMGIKLHNNVWFTHKFLSTVETHWEKSRQDDQGFDRSFKVLFGRDVCSCFKNFFVADKIVL